MIESTIAQAVVSIAGMTGVSEQTAATILVLAVTLTIVAVLALVVLPLAVKAAHRANPALSVEEFDLLVSAVAEDSDDD